jgi:hypothetical protein
MGVLATFHERGYQIIPERELRRTVGNSIKLPDGLIIASDGKEILWLEVENARKDGACKQHLVATLLKVAAGNAPILDGYRATSTLLCFVENARDEKGHVLNHLLRLTNEIKRTTKQPIRLGLGKITLAGAGVGSVELEKVTIESDKTMNFLRRMENIGWDFNRDGNKSCSLDGFEFAYWPIDQWWAWEITEDRPCCDARGYHDSNWLPKSCLKGGSASEAAAKRQLAESYEYCKDTLLDFPDEVSDELLADL